MTTFRRTLAATVAAAGLMFSSTAIAANPASKLSVARASAPAGQSKIGAEVSTATLISIGIVVAFAAIVLATTGDDDNGGKPGSP